MVKISCPLKFQIAALSLAVLSFCPGKAEAGTNAHRTFNVRNYGAAGNGTTDDTAAIQSALTAASNTGATVIFPQGTYLISSPLFSTGETLQGANATLTTNSNITMIVVTGTNTTVTGLTFTATSLQVGSAAIVANNAGGINLSNNVVGANLQTGIFVQNTTGGTIASNTMTSLTGVQANGISLLNDQNMVVEKNVISGTNSTGSASGIGETVCQNSVIRQNVITWSNTSGTSSGVLSIVNKSTQIYHNSVNGAFFGVQISFDTNPSATYNVITNSINCGILSRQNTNDTISTNSVTDSLNDAIRSNDSTGTTITTNTVSGAGANGIQSINGGNASVTNNQVANCGLNTAINAVISVNDPSANSIVVTGNQYKGNTVGVTNFIHVKQPFATVTGNKTNTLLPTVVGS